MPENTNDVARRIRSSVLLACESTTQQTENMGREIRRVPANWEHPKNAEGNYIPLLGDSYSKRLREWEEGNTKWEQGLRDDFDGGWKPREADEQGMTYAEWSGDRPEEKDYMPDWPESERTHIQMYEDCSEGTPISPVMNDPEKLAHWLADSGASAFGGMTATYEQWLATIRAGYSIGMVMTNGTLISGVEANETLKV